MPALLLLLTFLPSIPMFSLPAPVVPHEPWPPTAWAAPADGERVRVELTPPTWEYRPAALYEAEQGEPPSHDAVCHRRMNTHFYLWHDDVRAGTLDDGSRFVYVVIRRVTVVARLASGFTSRPA